MILQVKAFSSYLFYFHFQMWRCKALIVTVAWTPWKGRWNSAHTKRHPLPTSLLPKILIHVSGDWIPCESCSGMILFHLCFITDFVHVSTCRLAAHLLVRRHQRWVTRLPLIVNWVRTQMVVLFLSYGPASVENHTQYHLRWWYHGWYAPDKYSSQVSCP